ncbi:hypothetical protein HYH03_011380 [Edaphochlamys debaryana]|uniref:Prostaglandin E synthase 2 n=1 Tax=Edaphochlamys debaryana TaxID=47281 RepID=A0A836BV47_9CHLO|nr:hypothetical protein HYH03_011380 [Edaphochlamys debaryana]|eukprot:KAG2490256.1 hypothetical protein HYH03_011380 [Edaphochlamys debaryana]
MASQRTSAIAQAGAVSQALVGGPLGQQQGNRYTARPAILSAAAAFLGVSALSGVAADAETSAPVQVADDPYARPAAAQPLPSKITLYQYEVCPYCCKVRAMLDYYKLPYTVIEVNPLTKGELKWSTYKKVPVVKLDEEVVVDSSAIMSRLATDVAASRPAPAAAAAPAAPKKPSGGFSFFGSSGCSDESAVKDQGAANFAGPALEEEVKWRKWVDQTFVKVLTANIYRNWDEALETFKYITDQTSWSWGTRELARWSGAVIMWQVGKKMPKKYGIEGDLRLALYAAADDFVENGLRGRTFAGGAEPNLADVALFGVVRAVRQTGAFRDLMAQSKLAPWFQAMEERVGDSARVATVMGSM